MNKLRVLHLLDTRNWAGTERYILTLAAQQAATAAVEPVVGCPAGSPLHDRATEAGLKCLAIGEGSKPANNARNAISLRRIATQFDLLHSHNGRCLAAAVASGGRVVATQHFIRPASADRGGVKGTASRLISRALAQRVRRWIAISDASRTAMIDRGEISADRIELVYNGVAEPRYTRSRVETRRELEVVGDVPVVLCVCRLEPEKDVATLVDAAARLRTKPAIWIAGVGVERSTLETKAAKLAVPVRFLGMRADVADLMAAADVVVLPAPEEPFGLVLIEAMAVGRPIVACGAGGPLEIVQDGATGYLVKPRSPDDFAAAIDRLLDSPANRQRFSNAGRKRYEALFTAQQMEQGVRRMYERAMQQSSGQPA